MGWGDCLFAMRRVSPCSGTPDKPKSYIMAIKFEFYRTPVTAGTHKKRYYPKVIHSRCVDTEKLSQEIHKCCTLTVSDVRAVLIALSEQLASHLESGERVHLDGLGYFSVTLKAPEVSDPKTTRSTCVSVKTVRFRPDAELKELLEEAEIRRSDWRPHSQVWTDEEMEKRLADYFRSEPFLTRRKFQELFTLTRTTALRYIHRLIEEGKLRNAGTRAQPVYVEGKTSSTY